MGETTLFDGSAYSDPESFRNLCRSLTGEDPTEKELARLVSRLRREDLKEAVCAVDELSGGRALIMRHPGEHVYELVGPERLYEMTRADIILDGAGLRILAGDRQWEVRALKDIAHDGLGPDWGSVTADELFSDRYSLALGTPSQSVPAPAPTRHHGSLSLEEVAERLRQAGYEEWEVADEVSELVQTAQAVDENTRLLKQTGRFAPPIDPTTRERPDESLMTPRAHAKVHTVALTGLRGGRAEAPGESPCAPRTASAHVAKPKGVLSR